VEDEIANILAAPAEEADYEQAQRCLSAHDYRSFHVLDDRRIVFEGAHGKLWLNTLPMRCPDLRFATALRVKSTFSSSRICELDRFEAGDWFDLTWYRRWPWHWGSTWSSGVPCSLGEFQPINEGQLEAIRQALRSRSHSPSQ